MVRTWIAFTQRHTTPLEAANITTLVLWGAWVALASNIAPAHEVHRFAWASVAGVAGAAGFVPFTLGVVDFILTLMPGRTALRWRWVVNASAAAWWMVCIYFFMQTSFWVADLPLYVVAATMALSVVSNSRERIEVPTWKSSNSSTSSSSTVAV